jgi:hypothetical protein
MHRGRLSGRVADDMIGLAHVRLVAIFGAARGK